MNQLVKYIHNEKKQSKKKSSTKWSSSRFKPSLVRVHQATDFSGLTQVFHWSAVLSVTSLSEPRAPSFSPFPPAQKKRREKGKHEWEEMTNPPPADILPPTNIFEKWATI